MVALPVIGRDDALAAIAASRGARWSFLLLRSDLGKQRRHEFRNRIGSGGGLSS
jgi:hypothetical protein